MSTLRNKRIGKPKPRVKKKERFRRELIKQLFVVVEVEEIDSSTPAVSAPGPNHTVLTLRKHALWIPHIPPVVPKISAITLRATFSESWVLVALGKILCCSPWALLRSSEKERNGGGSKSSSQSGTDTISPSLWLRYWTPDQDTSRFPFPQSRRSGQARPSGKTRKASHPRGLKRPLPKERSTRFP
ncbi:unnamed protein product [Cyprideis torosa]|uniref:Uncharacterized protein n=1 Tax=Cyprideis torosa TaxID=163714 RepID=A0A7R8WRQ9_9CRUS|nr:unnamed protein product [Cyprideis torosa]CAG0904431.1 unnamed protein product [Cyprideis torosa]